VTVTDKRAEARAAAELKALEAEKDALEQVDEEGNPKLVLPGDSEEGDKTYRQQRIEELREMGREAQLTAEQAGELLRLQAAEEQGLDEENQVTPALTAFLVIIGHDGTATATHDVNLLMSLDRLATVDDMDSGCALVRRDIQASMTAKQVVFGLQVSAQAMGEKAQAMRMAQQMQAPRRR
jgi:hypothetical protein